METHYRRVKQMLVDLGLSIDREDKSEGIWIVSNRENGIENLVIDCDDPILILEQTVLLFPPEGKVNPEFLLKFLQINRNLVHGAFAMDEAGRRVIFRDTLRLENLDLNELEGSINALTLGLVEYGDVILAMAKQRAS